MFTELRAEGWFAVDVCRSRGHFVSVFVLKRQMTYNKYLLKVQLEVFVFVSFLK